MKITNDKNLKLSFIYTYIFGLIAHGYFYFNMFFSHDSTLVYQNDVDWQIQIGRYFHPLIFKIRGNYYIPWLVGIISLFFISLTVYLIIKLFKLQKKNMILLISGILTTNCTVTLISATYAHELDVYMIALFFAVLSVYIAINLKKGYLISPVLLFISLGLYQSFFQVSVFLFMMLIVKDILDKKITKEIIINIIKYLGILFASLIIYYIGLKLVLAIKHLSLYDSYNGLSNVGKYDSISSIINCIIYTYKKVISYFINPFTYHRRIMGIFNIIMIIIAAIMLIKTIIKKKIKLTNLLILILIIIFMPLGINIICFISQGMEHELMIYSFFFVYVFMLYIIKEYYDTENIIFEKINKNKKIYICIIPAMIIIMLFNNIIYSNQMYFYKNLSYQNTLLTFDRIINRLELTENYVVGESEVMFIGGLNSATFANKTPNIDLSGVGMSSIYSVTYRQTYNSFINTVMKYSMNIITNDTTVEYYQNLEEVKEMGTYPEKTSIKQIDGIFIVKLS